MKTLTILALLAFAGAACAQMNVTATPIGEGPTQYGPNTAYGPGIVWNASTTYGYYYVAGAGIGAADDAYLDDRYLINGFSFAYVCAVTDGVLDAEVKFLTGLPGGATVTEAAFSIPDLPINGGWLITIDLQGTGYEFGLGGGDVTLDVAYSLGDTGPYLTWGPDVGMNLFWKEEPFCSENWTGPYWFGEAYQADFYWQLYAVPEPGVVTSLAGLVLALGGIALRRR